MSVELNLGHEALVTGCVYAVLLTFSSVPREERRSLGGQRVGPEGCLPVSSLLSLQAPGLLPLTSTQDTFYGSRAFDLGVLPWVENN